MNIIRRSPKFYSFLIFSFTSGLAAYCLPTLLNHFGIPMGDAGFFLALFVGFPVGIIGALFSKQFIPNESQGINRTSRMKTFLQGGSVGGLIFLIIAVLMFLTAGNPADSWAQYGQFLIGCFLLILALLSASFCGVIALIFRFVLQGNAR
jgi:hypothetical protein